MASTERGELTKEKIVARARLLLQPLDLNDLTARGILVKKGAWYRILEFKAIPEHAWAKVSEIAQDARGSGSKVKFRKMSKRATAQLQKIAATDRKPNS